MTVHRGTIDALNRNFSTETLSWEAASTGGSGAPGAASTQVSVSTGHVTVDNFSTQVSVSGYVAPSTQVAVSNQSTQVAVSNFPAASTDVKVSNYSTTAQVSSVGGVVNVQQNSTVWQVQQGGYVAPTTNVVVSSLVVSTGFAKQAGLSVDTSNVLNVKLDGSTGVFIAGIAGGRLSIGSTAADNVCRSWNFDSTGNSLESSTRAVGVNSTMRGMAVRSLLPDCTSASGKAASSGDNSIISSVAGVGIYVYAYSISAVPVSSNICRWLDGSTHEVWRDILQAQSSFATSSGVSIMADHWGLSVSPPAYLFRTAAANPLLLSLTSSNVTYSVAAWKE